MSPIQLTVSKLVLMATDQSCPVAAYWRLVRMLGATRPGELLPTRLRALALVRANGRRIQLTSLCRSLPSARHKRRENAAADDRRRRCESQCRKIARLQACAGC